MLMRNKMKSTITINVLLLLLLIISSCRATEDTEQKPNVIVIIADDLGWADIGYNNPRVYTPNLDKLAINIGSKGFDGIHKSLCYRSGTNRQKTDSLENHGGFACHFICSPRFTSYFQRILGTGKSRPRSIC
jgi:hypothetical protein